MKCRTEKGRKHEEEESTGVRNDERHRKEGTDNKESKEKEEIRKKKRSRLLKQDTKNMSR